MKSEHLNEHDANQGAQSSGEFLGMTGNSGWYLLGSGGATILMVVLLWGVLGVSLLLCLFAGITLCLLSVAYVFALKNNKPDHYDTDFFEAALVEAGVLQFSFGPRSRRLRNPFRGDGEDTVPMIAKTENSSRRQTSAPTRVKGRASLPEKPFDQSECNNNTDTRESKKEVEPMVPRVVYEQLHEKLTNTEEMLEDALAETLEN